MLSKFRPLPDITKLGNLLRGRIEINIFSRVLRKYSILHRYSIQLRTPDLLTSSVDWARLSTPFT
jgi:hypothetical protein